MQGTVPQVLPHFSLFYPQDRGSMFLKNADTCLPTSLMTSMTFRSIYAKIFPPSAGPVKHDGEIHSLLSYLHSKPPFFLVFTRSYHCHLHPFLVYSIHTCYLSVLSSFFLFIVLVILTFTFQYSP